MNWISSSGNRRKMVLASLAVLIMLAIVVLLSFTKRGGLSVKPEISQSIVSTPSAGADRNPVTPSVESTPGLIIYGEVLDQSGAGVENVLIYRNYASYPGEVIATTDGSGRYESNFFAIPGDEMVGVWAEKSGFDFEPQYCRWRHYYGYERERCDFLAHQQ